MIPNSFKRFLDFLPRPVLRSTSTSESIGKRVVGSTISASKSAWSIPWSARTDFGGGFGSAGKGKDGSVARGVGDLRTSGESGRSFDFESPTGRSCSLSDKSFGLFLSLSSLGLSTTFSGAADLRFFLLSFLRFK